MIVPYLLLFLSLIATTVGIWDIKRTDLRERRIVILKSFLTLIAVATLIGSVLQLKSDYDKSVAESLEKEKLAFERHVKDSITIAILTDTKNNTGLIKRKTDSIIKDLELTTSAMLTNFNQTFEKQNSTIEQITGGRNKPILIGGFSTYIGNGKKDYSINFLLANSGKTVLHDIHFTVRNAYSGIENFLSTESDGGFSASVVGKDNASVNYGGQSLLSDINETGYNPTLNMFHLDRNVVTNVTMSSLDKTYPSAKNLYSERIPAGGNLYHFVATVEWANGSYTTKVSIKEFDTLTYYKSWKVYDHGVRVKDLFKYFNIRNPKIPKELIYCGKINYDDEVYEVYLNEKMQQITMLNRGSIYAQTFSIYKVKTKKEAIDAAMKTMKKVFG